MSEARAKTRVAVLGGGVSALTTAFELTRTEALRARYDVTVYQLGWRLGGKGASGRNQAVADRIEEHGLHIWMGFYENAFRVMQEAYAELGRAPLTPLASWEDAFRQHSYIVLEEQLDDGMHPWHFDFPTNDATPGTGELPSFYSYAKMLVQWIMELWEGLPDHLLFDLEADVARPRFLHHLDRLVESVAVTPRETLSAVDHEKGHGTFLREVPPRTHYPVSKLGEYALRLLHAVEHNQHLRSVLYPAIAWIMKYLRYLARKRLRPRVNKDLATRKLWVGLHMASAAVGGMLMDRIPERGWDSIDDVDLRAWLGKHGADDITLASGPMRGIYDLVFGYIGGDTKNGSFAAGTAMRGMLRMVFAYKGSIFYRMQAGMGDVVATPFYQVLRKRGVKFAFFHRVTALRLSEDKNLISRIELSKQVQLADGRGSYDPLVNVKGLDCWPSAPLYEQIADGAELAASDVNLESAWSRPWKDQQPITLELGKDFDQVVLGIAIGALPYVAADLIAHSKALADSVKHVQTVQTQALQLWLTEPTVQLGWQTPAGVTEAPVLGAFVEPIDTWADMSELVRRESWPDTTRPQSIAYFCGPLLDAARVAPFCDHDFPRRMLAAYRQLVFDFLNRDVKGLWPNAVVGDKFMWELLVDLASQRGDTRLDAQYMRVNIDPSERYVLSVPGSTRYRLRAKQLHFNNLVLAGDWTYNGLNAGCVEAAVMSGLQAAHALSGEKKPIIGGDPQQPGVF